MHQEPEVEIRQIRQEPRFEIEETARNGKNFEGRITRRQLVHEKYSFC